MPINFSHFDSLLKAIKEEENEQMRAYAMDNPASLKELKRMDLAIHPMKISNKSYGYLDYPELKLIAPYAVDSKEFKAGASVELICPGEESVKAVLVEKNEKSFIIRLFTGDFPDWVEDGSIGIKVAPDSRTLEIMSKSLELVESWWPGFKKNKDEFEGHEISTWENQKINHSQQEAIQAVFSEDQFRIIHGPPGTGKTTTILEAIIQLTKQGKRIAVSAPSNAAVDLVGSLIPRDINALRVGNNSKVPDELFHMTIEGRSKESGQAKTIKRLKIQAEELRKMAHQYKRSFGRDERNQRKLLFQEVNNIRKEIRALRAANEQKLIEKAQVILGTPVGLFDQTLDYHSFDVLIIDEAGQCLEPLAWAIIPLGKKIILAGDPHQLPPTVMSRKAEKLGLNISILERMVKQEAPCTLLNIQYRMPPELIAFSNAYFYQNELQSHLVSAKDSMYFYDTVGTETKEEHLDGHHSLSNSVEQDYILKLIEVEGLKPENTNIISPYSGQVSQFKKSLGPKWRISTIDSFQGQEKENIILSLVRSNDRQDIGFLKDYRRMNVALTRAKKRLFVFGDSGTLGTDKFYQGFLDEMEKQEAYHSCWELE
jgi:ATP-dependent RNA/DNA helicase IGHMBP2